MPGEPTPAANSSTSRNNALDASRSDSWGWFGASVRKSVQGITNTSATASPLASHGLTYPLRPAYDVLPNLVQRQGRAPFHEAEIDAVELEQADQLEDALVLEEAERVVGAGEPHRRHGPELPRGSKTVGSMTSRRRRPGRAILASSSSAALPPSSFMSRRTTSRGGWWNAVSSVSSHATTERSAGTRRPRSRIAPKSPAKSWLLPAITAVGGSRRSRSSPTAR